jgi:hypothetical protein
VRTLWHYTCDHGRDAIGDRGNLVPLATLRPDKRMTWQGRLVWLTDLERPQRDALGLTSHILNCDRTVHRYRVTDAALTRRWTSIARDLPRGYREALESAPGARPRHWWVSENPVPVEYDPIQPPARAATATPTQPATDEET